MRVGDLGEDKSLLSRVPSNRFLIVFNILICTLLSTDTRLRERRVAILVSKRFAVRSERFEFTAFGHVRTRARAYNNRAFAPADGKKIIRTGIAGLRRAPRVHDFLARSRYDF